VEQESQWAKYKADCSEAHVDKTLLAIYRQRTRSMASVDELYYSPSTRFRKTRGSHDDNKEHCT
jgi:hypothetical protein